MATRNNRKSLIYTTRSTLIGTQNEEDSVVDVAERQTLELERLEQEITLTLQEIDRNLATANKIIGDSLIPIIQSYTTSSRNLWNSTKFWKYFFEDSANVQISGVEKLKEEQDGDHEDGVDDEMMNVDEFQDTTGGQSIIDRYQDQMEQSSTLIKSTPKRVKNAEKQPPSSPPATDHSNLITSSIFDNVNQEEQINFHKAYKVTLTPNKRRKGDIYDDSPELAPPLLTSISPLKNTDGSIQMESPPRTMSFAKSQDYVKRTPSRTLAKSKTNDLKEIVGANDSSLQQPPQFTLTDIRPQLNDNDSSIQQNPPQLTSKKDYELDSILDSKFQQFNKTNDIDWSGEE